MQFDDIAVGKRLFVGEGKPEVLGRGPTEIRGSSYIEGPMIVGTPPPVLTASLMVGPSNQFRFTYTTNCSWRIMHWCEQSILPCG